MFLANLKYELTIINLRDCYGDECARGHCNGKHGRSARLHERTNHRLQQQKVTLLLEERDVSLFK
jgi:hypothetical protein